MNILLVTYGSPYPPNSGAAIRDYNLIRYISRTHNIFLLSLLYFPRAPGWERLKDYCEVVDLFEMPPHSLREQVGGALRCLLTGRPIATNVMFYREVAEKIRKLVTARHVDIVQIEQSLLAPYIEALPPGGNWKTILSFHNLGFVQFQRYLRMQIGPKERLISTLKWLIFASRWEARYAERFDHCVVVSTAEHELLKTANPRLRVSLVENGIDTQLCQPLEEASSGNVLLFVGSLMYPPNVDAVLFFCDSILPRIRQEVPDAKLLVVGHHAPSRIQTLAARHDVTVAGQVPDMKPYYQQARLSVVPLRAGGGTRIKILEAMACGRPVVSTSLGCEGIHAIDEEHLLIADTPAEFAARVVEALKNRELRERLSRNARKLVESRYDWSLMAQRLLRVYSELGVATPSGASV